ncbi:hypothetical protein [Cohnella mopanensis]|nr:hypothetical protein [Cohnella mopanensis]
MSIKLQRQLAGTQTTQVQAKASTSPASNSSKNRKDLGNVNKGDG